MIEDHVPQFGLPEMIIEERVTEEMDESRQQSERPAQEVEESDIVDPEEILEKESPLRASVVNKHHREQNLEQDKTEEKKIEQDIRMSGRNSRARIDRFAEEEKIQK